jgi:hypothetical protein
MTEEYWFDFRRGKGFSIVSTEAHPGFNPMGTGVCSPEGKAARVSHLAPRLRTLELYLYALIHLHGVMLD